MGFETCYNSVCAILMEGALGERLKREYGLEFDDDVAMASLIYNHNSQIALSNIWHEYISVAKEYNLPFIATTPTRRANKERVSRSQFNEKIIKDNVQFLRQIQKSSNIEMYVGGLMGCKGDAYHATDILSVDDARIFHSWQAELFKYAGADFLFAGIMPALSEAVGMAKAMEQTGLPYIISFMIRKNGKLIDGTPIHNAIMKIDYETERKPLCYMTNCVHPLVLKEALSCPFNKTELVQKRFHGIQANTSPLSPEELDNCIDLKTSDRISLAENILELNKYITLKIYGGCCGTGKTHMEEIAKKLNYELSI
ncbi:homocysteine S-methyltransferase family protein [Oscillospiraceae bacterium PP1C4]